jgi:hypothetical protein
MPQEKVGFNKYIDDILTQVKKNENLMKLIFYNSMDALNKVNLTPQEKDSLIYTKIFPYRFIPTISDTACSYLNLGFGNFREISNVFQAGKIGFYMVSYKELWKMNGGLRPVFMLEEIKEVAKSLEGLGLGRLKLTNSDEYMYNNNFTGYFALYEIVDFNR